jgi:hypothetical protein
MYESSPSNFVQHLGERVNTLLPYVPLPVRLIIVEQAGKWQTFAAVKSAHDNLDASHNCSGRSQPPQTALYLQDTSVRPSAVLVTQLKHP